MLAAHRSLKPHWGHLSVEIQILPLLQPPKLPLPCLQSGRAGRAPAALRVPVQQEDTLPEGQLEPERGRRRVPALVRDPAEQDIQEPRRSHSRQAEHRRDFAEEEVGYIHIRRRSLGAAEGRQLEIQRDFLLRTQAAGQGSAVEDLHCSLAEHNLHIQAEAAEAARDIPLVPDDGLRRDRSGHRKDYQRALEPPVVEEVLFQ